MKVKPKYASRDSSGRIDFWLRKPIWSENGLIYNTRQETYIHIECDAADCLCLAGFKLRKRCLYFIDHGDLKLVERH